MAAVLTNGKGFYHPLVYVLECHRLGIPLLPPSINQPGPQFTVVQPQGKIRVPVLLVKGLTHRTKDAILSERERGEFASLPDFFLRVQPLSEEMEALIRVGAFDAFGQTRTTQYWEFKALATNRPVAGQASRPWSPLFPVNQGSANSPSPAASQRLAGTDASWKLAPLRQVWLLPPVNLDRLPCVPLAEPDRLQRLRWEEELLGYPASGHPLELFPDIAWDTYCPVSQLGRYPGQPVLTCGLVIEQRLFHQSTGEPMKFLTLADGTGVVETELFARAYQSSGLATIRYRVLEIAAIVEPFESGRGFTLRVLRAGRPRRRGQRNAECGPAFAKATAGKMRSGEKAEGNRFILTEG
jgi:DNA polymerase III alpha subunit